MTTRKKIDFSLLSRHASSSTSSTDLPPMVPTLESPITFHAMTRYDHVNDSTPKKNRMELGSTRPAMFVKAEDDDTLISDGTKSFSADSSFSPLTRRDIEREPPYRSKSQYFENAFSLPGSYLSPRTRLSEASLVVVELRLSTKVQVGSIDYKNPSLTRFVLDQRRLFAGICHCFSNGTDLPEA